MKQAQRERERDRDRDTERDRERQTDRESSFGAFVKTESLVLLVLLIDGRGFKCIN